MRSAGGIACAKQIRAEWVDLTTGCRRFDLGCACGWSASTNDGWNALAEFYDHVGILPGPTINLGQVEDEQVCTSAGCCTACFGTGSCGWDGPCTDCYGTGHAHAQDAFPVSQGEQEER